MTVVRKLSEIEATHKSVSTKQRRILSVHFLRHILSLCLLQPTTFQPNNLHVAMARSLMLIREIFFTPRFNIQKCDYSSSVVLNVT